MTKSSAVILIAAVFLFNGTVFGKTAACPCNPCPCAPCTCGQSKSGSSKPPATKSRSAKTEPGKTATSKGGTKGHEARREKEHGHSDHVGASVGANIDLGGIGHRRAEADPFAVPHEPVRTAQTEEKVGKPKTKPKEESVTTTEAFANVQLTGGQAKATEAANSSAGCESKP